MKFYIKTGRNASLLKSMMDVENTNIGNGIQKNKWITSHLAYWHILCSFMNVANIYTPLCCYHQTHKYLTHCHPPICSLKKKLLYFLNILLSCSKYYVYTGNTRNTIQIWNVFFNASETTQNPVTPAYPLCAHPSRRPPATAPLVRAPSGEEVASY